MSAASKIKLKNNLALCFIALSALCMPFFASAATFRVVPPASTIKEGETISVTVSITSDDQSMNAAEGVLKFPTELLQVVGVSKAGSILGLWVQEPSYSNTLGTVNFEGVALNPGYTGTNGTILTIIFRARAQGSASLSIEGGSVLANDGNGTQILTGTSGSTLTLVPAPPAAPAAPTAPTKSKPRTSTAPVIEPVTPQAPVASKEEPAPPIQKAVVEKPFDLSKYFAWLGDIRSLIFAIVIITFGILNILLFMQYLRLRKKEGGSLDHAQIVAHRSFLILRDDVDTFSEELEGESKKRELTPTEKRFVKDMRGDLSSAEKAIVKELRDNEKRSQ